MSGSSSATPCACRWRPSRPMTANRTWSACVSSWRANTRGRMSPRTDPKAFRRVLGLFATGVTVVAAQHDDEIHGMTANAVNSVSLDPLLVLVCVGKHARMNQVIQGAGGFSINVLAEAQEPLSRDFSGAWPHQAPPEFRFVPWPGGPRLVGALAAVGCVVDRRGGGGGPPIVLGRGGGPPHDGHHPPPPLFFRRPLSPVARAGTPHSPPAPGAPEHSPNSHPA